MLEGVRSMEGLAFTRERKQLSPLSIERPVVFLRFEKKTLNVLEAKSFRAGKQFFICVFIFVELYE